MNIDNREKRVIDTNELVEKKLEFLRQQKSKVEADGFAPGIFAQEVTGEYIGDAADALFADNESSEESEGEFVAGLEAPRVDSSEVLMRANEEAESILADARAQAQSIIDDAIASAEGEKQAIYDDAANKGYADGQATAQQELAQAMSELEAKGSELEAEYQKQIEQIEPQLVETITDIYSQIFGIELASQKQIVLHLLETAIRRIEGSNSYLIHASSETSQFLMDNKETLAGVVTLPGSIVEIIEDVTLSGNDCFIETEGGIFDCSVDTQLAELTQKLRLLSYTP